jgi:hypothetical protein
MNLQRREFWTRAGSFVTLGALTMSSVRAVADLDDPVLRKITVVTHTYDKDRDHDTCMTVEYRKLPRFPIFAAVYHGNCNGPVGDPNGSHHEWELPILRKYQGAQYTRSQIYPGQWRIDVTPNGSNIWNFSAWLVFHFADGSFDWLDKTGLTLGAEHSPFHTGSWTTDSGWSRQRTTTVPCYPVPRGWTGHLGDAHHTEDCCGGPLGSDCGPLPRS